MRKHMVLESPDGAEAAATLKHPVCFSSSGAGEAHTCEKTWCWSPPKAPRLRTPVKKWFLSPPRAPRQQQQSSPRFFEPPEGAEAAHTYEKTWFPRSPRAPGQHMFHAPPPPLPRPCPRRRRGSNNLQAQGFLSPLMAPRQHTLAKRHDFGVPRGRQGNRHPRKNTWSLSPPRSRRQQQPVTHIVFKPPSGDEAETTCESIWFLSSPRAPRQRPRFQTLPPPPRVPRKEESAKSRIRELPGNFREVPGKFSRKSRDPPRDFPENPRGPRGIPRRISRGIRGKFFGNHEGFFPNSRHSTRRLIGRRLIPPNFGAEAATPSNICFVVVLPPRAPRKHTLVNTHSSHVFCTPPK